jgi:hypothetical protein
MPPTQAARRRVIFSDQQVEAFLLGRAEESTAQQMEELLFEPESENDQFFQQMQCVKRSLIEREAIGRLDPELSAALALQLARSPALQEELEQARAAHAARSPLAARTRSPRASSEGWWWNAGLATAALMALAMAGMLLTRQKANPFRERIVASARSNESVEHAGQTTSGAAAAATILFVPSGVLRGPSSPAAFHAPAHDHPVELQVETHSRASDGTLWSVSILKNSRAVFEDPHALGMQAGVVHYVRIAIPPGILSPGPYQVTLTPRHRDADGGPSLAPFSRSFTLTP